MTYLPFDCGTPARAAEALPARFPELVRTEVIGESAEGRPLLRLRVGHGRRRVLFVGAHHGMEWLTAPLLLTLLEEFCAACAAGADFAGLDARYAASVRTLSVVPLLNPDGMARVQRTGERWQANARGVDLNHNYDADWEASLRSARSLGIDGPGPTRWPGPHPESEPETQALCALVRREPPARLYCFHTQGEELYHGYGDLVPRGSARIARLLAEASGYRAARPEAAAATGGCKDWFVRTYRRPGFTVEAGRGQNPLPPEELPALVARLRRLFALAVIL